MHYPGIVDDDNGDNPVQVSCHRNVAHGERQALRIRWIQQFQDICVTRPSGRLNTNGNDLGDQTVESQSTDHMFPRS